MATLAPGAFAARLGQIASSLRGMARVASDGLLDGMGEIAEVAVKRLVERTPRSDGPGPHLADGWTARQVDVAPGWLTIDVINVHPAATEPLRTADGRVQGYTLLEVLEYGSVEHEIKPVNAKVLAFMGSGGMVFARLVNHPGTDPYAMVSTTEAEVAVDVKRLIDSTRRTLTIRSTGKR